MKYFTLIIITMVLYVVNIQRPDTVFRSDDQHQQFSIMDSLRKFEGRDTLLIDDAMDATLYIGTSNKKPYGVYVVSEKTLAFYQKKQNSGWELTDHLTYEYLFSYARSGDINGDSVEDVRVASFSGVSANTENIVFLYDKRSGMFRHNEYYDLPNVAYDKEHKFIRSSWFAGAMHCQSKFKYVMSGDSLIFDRGSSFCPNYDNMKMATFVEYSQVGDKRIVIDSINGSAGKLWKRFEKGFWDSEHDMK